MQVLVFLVAFLAGMGSVLDCWQFHQPIIACFLIGLVTGHVAECLVLGGTLQLIALGWMNIGAAIAPDAALASVCSAILVVDGSDVNTAIAMAMPLAIAGLVLTSLVRTLSVVCVHGMDAAADKGSIKGVEMWQYIAMAFQGLRVAIPAAIVMSVPTDVVQAGLNAIPDWLTSGLAVGGGMVVAVGYAMVINMMATPDLWPFFYMGFALAAVSDLNLVAMGIIGVCRAQLDLQHSPAFNAPAGTPAALGSGGADPLDDILADYE